MKKIVLSASALMVLAIPTLLLAQPSDKQNPINITNIKTLKHQDSQAAEYSMRVAFSVGKGHEFDQWALGFYMARTFNKSKKSNVNPNLTMTICRSNGNGKCQGKPHPLKFVRHPLHYDKPSQTGHTTYYGTGYSNLFMPKNQNYSLKPGTYLIKFDKSNQWQPLNLSEMPQNFFLIKHFVPKGGSEATSILPIHTPKSLYKVDHINGYDKSDVDKTIDKRIKKHKQNSIPRKENHVANQLGLVPSPYSVKLLNDSSDQYIHGFTIKSNKNHPIQVYLGDFELNKRMIVQEFKHRMGQTIDIKKASAQSKSKPIKYYPIRVVQGGPPQGEAYELTVKDQHIVIKAADRAGAYYGIQTLEQLWHNAQSNGGDIKALKIKDKPRFEYRGVLLDVARHYFSIHDMKRLIDAMAAQKLNTLHLHLADDEGFRLDLPALKGKQSQRASTRGYYPGSSMPASKYTQANLDKTNYKNFDKDNNNPLEPKYTQADDRYQGKYTKKEIRNLVHYANEHQVTIIPEIDLPGHAKALVESNRGIFVNPKDNSDYISTQGYYQDTMPVCLYNNQQGKQFRQKINAIIQQTGKWFSGQPGMPNQEVSVGGDEVAGAAWTNDKTCDNNAPWNKKPFKDSDTGALNKSQQFFKMLHQGVNDNDDGIDINLSGWSQSVQMDSGNIGQFAMPPEATRHIWVWNVRHPGIHNSVKLANNGYPVVVALANDTYFDLSYTAKAWEPGFHWAGHYINTHSALRSALDATTILNKVDKGKTDNILGLEGTLWSENIMNFRHLGYMALPKMTGLAEAAWSPESKTVRTENDRINWSSLAYRLGLDNNQGFLGWLNHLSGIKYRGYPNGISEEWFTSS